MDKEEIMIWHNIVYSAKGGCGKTTFCTLARKISLLDNVTSIDFSQGSLIVVDLDLLASNLGYYDTEFIERFKNSEDVKLMDYILQGGKFVDRGFKYLENCQIKGVTGVKPFMLICSPRTESERGYFKSKRRYLPVVKYDEFKHGFKSLLLKISNMEEKPINIFYDLPPNSDGYTEIVFDVLMNYKSELQTSDIKSGVRLFVLSNKANSIVKVNLSWLYNYLNESGANKKPEETYFLVDHNNEERITLADDIESNAIQGQHPHLQYSKMVKELSKVYNVKFGNIAEFHLDKSGADSTSISLKGLLDAIETQETTGSEFKDNI